MRSPLLFAICFALALPAAARAQDSARDIVDTASSVEGFSTLVAAVKAAHLDGALKSKGPFTVFAPTDAAFRLLPQGTVQNLLQRSQRSTLQSILKFHVVSGRLTAADLIGRRSLTTLNGQRLVLSNENAGLRVNGATIRITDIGCSNGVIHVIDSVLLPESSDIAGVAKKAGSFQTLLAAAKAAGLVPALTGKGPLTVFAPTDEAFAKLPRGTVASLLKPENKAKLQAILKYHVVAGRIDAESAVRAGRAATLEGTEVEIGFRNGALRVAEARIVATDIAASNGVIHVIDRVILPPSPAAKNRQTVMRLLENAIDRGAPRFNDGDIESCVAIYATAAEAVVLLGGDLITGRERNALRAAIASKSDAREQAWELRRAIDVVYERMDRESARPTERAPTRDTSRNDTRSNADASFKPAHGSAASRRVPEARSGRPRRDQGVSRTTAPRVRRVAPRSGPCSTTSRKTTIEMTAPVEMTMDERNGTHGADRHGVSLRAPAAGPSPAAMVACDVLDKKPIKVLEHRHPWPDVERQGRGREASDSSRASADIELEGVKGEWRLLGYNSPMVPPAQRFWELQLPIASATP